MQIIVLYSIFLNGRDWGWGGEMAGQIFILISD